MAETNKHTDLSNLRDVGGGDVQFMKDLIQTFVKVTPDHLNGLILNFESKNWVEFKRIAHTIKPNVEFMGIRSLKEIFQEIDKLPAEEVGTFINNDIIAKLKEVLAESCAELSEEIKHL